MKVKVESDNLLLVIVMKNESHEGRQRSNVRWKRDTSMPYNGKRKISHKEILR